MKTTGLNINLPLNFDQIIEIIRQLPAKEKRKLFEVLKNEKNKYPDNDEVITHIASEDVLAKDWLSPTEDEAWKDL